MNKIALALYNAQNKFDSMLRDRKGATSVEYALMLIAILIVVAVGFKALGKKVNADANKAQGTI